MILAGWACVQSVKRELWRVIHSAFLTDMKHIYRPNNQADCDHANALREYESVHKTWMNTSVFTEAGQKAKADLNSAREKYSNAVKVARPNWIVM